MFVLSIARRAGGLFVAACAILTSAVLPAFAQHPLLDDDPAVVGCGKARAFERLHQFDDVRRLAREEYESLRDGGLREAYEATDVLHCALDIELIPGAAFGADNIIGTNTMTVRSKTNGLTQFTFRLDDGFTISSAVLNGFTPAIITQASGTTRVVTLDRAYGLDEVFTLSVSYHGIADEGFGSIYFTTQGGVDLVYTLSEPYFSYTWWPAKDGDFADSGDNGDKFLLDMWITAPSNMVSLSNGMPEGVDALSGGRSRHHWATDYELSTYLVFLSSTEYHSWSQMYTAQGGGMMTVDFYIYEQYDSPPFRTLWERVMGMLPVFAGLFGEYPFVDEKYGIYQFGFSGGMEHQTFTGQGSFGETITAHELGHQWWGDALTCRTWNDLWLNEGFATYCEALWAEFKPGSTGLPALQAVMAGKRYLGSGSVYIPDDELDDMGQIFNPNTTYNKGGWVLHMLRHVLGDEDFFAALVAYRTAYEGAAVSTADFQAVCESFYGGSLLWFFSEWIYGERTPSYQYGWVPIFAGGRHYLALHTNQVQNFAYQRFTMPLDVVVNGATYTIFNDVDTEHFLIPLPAAAASVQLDPDAWVLWNTKAEVPYVAGPPKIVEVNPAPGTVVPAGGATPVVRVTFHTDVITLSGDYLLVGLETGARPFGFSYDAPSHVATLTLDAALPPDVYTLTVSDGVAAADSHQRLDGETTDPSSLSSLPTGDGLPLGASVFRFEVACPGDAECDGDVDLADFARFQQCYSGEAAPAAVGCGALRLDGDVDVDGADFGVFTTSMTGPQ